MNWKMIFKVSALVSALSLTVYSMYLLNSGHSSDFMASMGMGAQGQNLNWCTNRVIKLESAEPGNAWVLEDKDQQWILSVDHGEFKKVEYLDVEKWFAKYCILHIQVYRGVDVLEMQLSPFAKATFNDEKEARIVRLGPELFQINEVVFKSIEFETALEELRDLLKI